LGQFGPECSINCSKKAFAIHSRVPDRLTP
jgi:hypothetical protein